MSNQIVIVNTDEMEHPSQEMEYSQVRDMMYSGDGKPEVVVMVQAYGRIDKTRACVESILKYTSGICFELWLLDNGSEEEDVFEYFQSVTYEPKKIIRVSKNITGVFAVNTVLKMMTAKYIVIVNNDIIVTEKWLDNLLACAESDPKIGMICPLSTNISNRQVESLGGFADLDEMQAKAAKFNQSDPRKWEERMCLIPSATLYRREIFDEMGFFDVGFVHDFGDDDFSFRLRRAGYKLIVCRDTFVHHNHYMQERDFSGLENQRSENGRRDFKKKYRGLDAWEDGRNHIVEFSHYGELEHRKWELTNILGVDARCGAPILDVKNKLKAEGYRKFHVDAFTTDLKYYLDLNSISDAVEHDNIANILAKYRERKYQMIVLGEALNSYQRPREVLLDLVSLLDREGALLCSVYNCDNIYEFLWQQGLMDNSDADRYQRLPYEEVVSALKDTKLKKLDINFTIFPVTDEVRNFAEQRAYPGLQEGRDEMVQNLFVRQYWFWIQKA